MSRAWKRATATASVFGDDLIAPLTDLDATRFASYRQVPGTGWTIAAMVATQCAVPLKRITVFDENTQGELVQSFLQNATCLSDILAEHGYRNVFLGGGSPTFAGKGKFLRAHHYDEVLGKEDWLRLGVPDSAMNGWGLFDEDLFCRARAKLKELHGSGLPFNLTLLTVNSHEPFGFMSSQLCAAGPCRFRWRDPLHRPRCGGVRAFRHRQRVFARHEYRHPRRPPGAPQSADEPTRTPARAFAVQCLCRRDPPARNREQLLHFDLLPTILEFNGFTVDGGRLGLGYSAFNRHAVQPEAHRLEAMRSSLPKRSATYRALWVAQ